MLQRENAVRTGFTPAVGVGQIPRLVIVDEQAHGGGGGRVTPGADVEAQHRPLRDLDTVGGGSRSSSVISGTPAEQRLRELSRPSPSAVDSSR